MIELIETATIPVVSGLCNSSLARGAWGAEAVPACHDKEVDRSLGEVEIVNNYQRRHEAAYLSHR